MKMIALILGLILTGPALAGSSFNFSPATDGTYKCGNYCVGYATDSADTVGFANLTIVSTTSRDLKLTIQIDGDYYSGVLPLGDGSVPFVVSKVDGGYALVTVAYTSKTTCVHSGRLAGRCTTWRYVNSGTVQL